jgi:predicted alpha/beta-fold hydrolase
VTPSFRPAWWLRGAHAQTLWGKFARRTHVPTRLERWATPDDDFVELHRLDAAPGAPRLVILHGLEGSVRSHYVGGLLDQARRRGWGADLLVFRSCGTEPNRARRFYHSGETEDLAFVLDRVHQEHPESALLLAGVSLGGNVLLKLLGEGDDRLPPTVRAAATVSVPYDLGRGARHIGRGFSRVYERHFLRSLRRKALEKLERYPDLVERERLAAARTLWDFDDVVTAPVHGFASADDYYGRSSSLRVLRGIRRPTLLLSAVDDPFLPAAVLDEVRREAAGNPALELEFVAHGGHVGFVAGAVPWRPVYWAERRVAEHLARFARSTADESTAPAPRRSA